MAHRCRGACRVGVWLFVALVLARTSYAQAGGSLTGTVKDPSGGVIPGVTVALMNTALGNQLTAVTDGQGAYSFPNVPVGRYDLSITLDGFKPQRRAGVAVDINSRLQIDPTLEVQPLSPTSVSHRFDAVRRGLTVGLVLVLLLIGLVLLVSVGEQLRERRRALAVLAVLGLPRRVLVGSVLAESGLPVVLGAVVAAVTGAALGSVLLVIVGRAALPDPGVVLATAAAALLVPLLVTAASLPATIRLLRPEHMRAE